jgi:hypothetical protein
MPSRIFTLNKKGNLFRAHVYFLFCAARVTIKLYSLQILKKRSGWTAMKIGDWMKSEVEYGRDLADSGWQGARTACESVLHGEPVGAILSRSARASWAPTVMGAGVGALCALLARRREPKTSSVVAMGVVGGFVGFTAGVAWETRQLSSEIARGALRNVSSTSDSHWLGKHPIDFG